MKNIFFLLVLFSSCSVTRFDVWDAREQLQIDIKSHQAQIIIYNDSVRLHYLQNKFLKAQLKKSLL